MDEESLIEMNWDSFGDHLKDMMRDMLISEDLTDVTIITEDHKRFKAHKNILSSSSPVLKDLLKGQYEANQILFMKGVSSAEIQSILEFIYVGSVTVDHEKVHELVDLAKDLKIKSLENMDKEEEIEVTPKKKTEDCIDPEPVVQSTAKIESLVFLQPRVDCLEVSKVIIEDEKINGKDLIKINEDEDLIIDEEEPNAIEDNSTISLEQFLKHSSTVINGSIDEQIDHKGTHELTINNEDHLTINEEEPEEHTDIKGTHEMVIDEEGEGHFIINEEETGESRHETETISVDDEKRSSKENSAYTDFKPMTSRNPLECYFCQECQKSYKTSEGFRIHKQSKHKGIRYPCDQCKFSGITVFALKDHIKAQHEGIKFDCDKCSNQYNSRNILKRHQQLKHDGIKYPCNDCNHQASSKPSLNYHIQVVHLQIPYQCNLCDFQAKKKEPLKNHKIIEHGYKPNSCFGEKEIKLKINKKGTKILKNKKNKKFPQKDFECTKCNKIYTTRTGLRVHTRSEHDGIRHQCPDCNFKGITKGGLTVHIQAVHEQIRYFCNECDHQSTTQGSLKLHIDAAHGDNVYFCVECDFKTRQRMTLHTHLRSKHSYQRVTADMLHFKKESKETQALVEVSDAIESIKDLDE